MPKKVHQTFQELLQNHGITPTFIATNNWPLFVEIINDFSKFSGVNLETFDILRLKV